MFKEALNGSWRKFAFILKMTKINISFTISETKTVAAKAARKNVFRDLMSATSMRPATIQPTRKYARAAVPITVLDQASIKIPVSNIHLRDS